MAQIAFMTAKVKTLVANTTISAATNAAPIAVTTGTHGYETGDIVQISGVTGNLAANGQWVITKTGATTFTLNNSNGSGAYSSGGTGVHIGFACAAVLVDNTIFTAVPDFTLKFSADTLASGTTVRGMFFDSADSAFVTEQPLTCFVKPGALVASNGAKFSVKKADVANALLAASGDNMRLKVYLTGGPGASGTFTGFLEY